MTQLPPCLSQPLSGDLGRACGLLRELNLHPSAAKRLVVTLARLNQISHRDAELLLEALDLQSA